jgi:hypothetical protein
VFGGVENLQVLLHGGILAGGLSQAVISDTEPRGGIHVMNIFIVQKRPRRTNEPIDHVAEVDGFLAAAEQPRQPFQAPVLMPQFQMILMNVHVEFQADIRTADGVRVAFDPDYTVRLHADGDRSRHRRATRGQRV